MEALADPPAEVESQGDTQAVEIQTSRALAVASRGLRTTRDAANVLGAVVLDVLGGQMSPRVANTTISAIGKMCVVKELELKHGQPTQDGKPSLTLADDPPSDAKQARRALLLRQIQELEQE